MPSAVGAHCEGVPVLARLINQELARGLRGLVGHGHTTQPARGYLRSPPVGAWRWRRGCSENYLDRSSALNIITVLMMICGLTPAKEAMHDILPKLAVLERAHKEYQSQAFASKDRELVSTRKHGIKCTRRSARRQTSRFSLTAPSSSGGGAPTLTSRPTGTTGSATWSPLDCTQPHEHDRLHGSGAVSGGDPAGIHDQPGVETISPRTRPRRTMTTSSTT